MMMVNRRKRTRRRDKKIKRIAEAIIREGQESRRVLNSAEVVKLQEELGMKGKSTIKLAQIPRNVAV